MRIRKKSRGDRTRPHRYDATLLSSTQCYTRSHKLRIHTQNTRARGRSRRGTLSKIASFIVDSCRDPGQRPEILTRDVRLEKNDCLGTMHTSDIVDRLHTFLRGARSFTEEISHMSDFSCGETKVRNDP